jgi:hypothetical protein
MNENLNRIAWLLDLAYSELTSDIPDLETVLGCVAEAKAIAEEPAL